MAEQAVAATDADQYELGNTDYIIETPDKPAPPAPIPGESPVIDIGDRPRNPDGTFKPFKASSTVTAAAVAPPEPPAPEMPPYYLVEAARDFGYDDAEIQSMHKAGVLHKTMFMSQRRMEAVRQQASRQMLHQDGQVRNPEPEPPAQDELDFEVNEEELHPTIAKGLSALRNRAKAEREENKALRAEVTALRTRDEQRELNRAAALYDAAFTALGDEFAPIIGKGAGRDMNSDSAEYKRRIAILTEARADPRQLTPAQVKAKVKAAADLLYPRPKAGKAKEDAYAEVAEPRTNGRAPRISTEEWNDAALARPTQRRVDDEPPSEKKAVRNLAAKMREQDDVIADSEELEGFL